MISELEAPSRRSITAVLACHDKAMLSKREALQVNRHLMLHEAENYLTMSRSLVLKASQLEPPMPLIMAASVQNRMNNSLISSLLALRLPFPGEYIDTVPFCACNSQPRSFTRLRVHLKILVCSKRSNTPHEHKRVETDAQARTF